MAEKSDEDIIKEVGLETSNELDAQEALDKLSLDDNDEKDDVLTPNEEDTIFEEIQTVDETQENTNTNNNTIENEDRDDINENKTTENNNQEDIEEVNNGVIQALTNLFKKEIATTTTSTD